MRGPDISIRPKNIFSQNELKGRERPQANFREVSTKRWLKIGGLSRCFLQCNGIAGTFGRFDSLTERVWS
jgi:hypothetical protein